MKYFVGKKTFFTSWFMYIIRRFCSLFVIWENKKVVIIKSSSQTFGTSLQHNNLLPNNILSFLRNLLRKEFKMHIYILWQYFFIWKCKFNKISVEQNILATSFSILTAWFLVLIAVSKICAISGVLKFQTKNLVQVLRITICCQIIYCPFHEIFWKKNLKWIYFVERVSYFSIFHTFIWKCFLIKSVMNKNISVTSFSILTAWLLVLSVSHFLQFYFITKSK
jgi:hypothetical protein